jgi:hypothetical protein
VVPEDAMNQRELHSLGFVAWKLELLKRDSVENRVEAVIFMAPKICLNSSTDFESKRILDSRKSRRKILFTPKLGGMC